MTDQAAAIRIPHLTYRKAELGDVSAVTQLVNSAYRGEASTAGWTTEAHLLKGKRTDEAGIRALIEAPDSMLLLCIEKGELIGSVHLAKSEEGVGYLGMFVVRPVLQGAGIGKRFMQMAEETARCTWDVARMAMAVISLRPELVAYYERRGYRLTGEVLPFPFEDGLSEALVEGIELAVMEKDL